MILRIALPVLVTAAALALPVLDTAPIAAPAAAAEPASAAARSFKIDAVHSSVLFRIKHADAAWFWGRFNRIEGAFAFDDENPAASTLSVTIPIDGVDTGNAARDKHLKQTELFSAIEFPTATFVGTGFEKKGDAWTVTGDFTLRGKTRPVTVTVTHVGTSNLNEKMGVRTGYDCRFEIRRSDHGMTWGLDDKSLGDDVLIQVSIEGKAS